MKKKEGFEFGRMVFGCAIVAFVSVFVWFMSEENPVEDTEPIDCLPHIVIQCQPKGNGCG